MNDSREFQDVESICSGKLYHVPSQRAIVPSLGGLLSSGQSLRPDTWNLLGTSGNVFDNPRTVSDPSSTPHQGILHSWNPYATGGDSVQLSTEKPVARRKKEIEKPFQRRDLQGDHRPGFLSSQRRSISAELHGRSIKRADHGTSI